MIPLGDQDELIVIKHDGKQLRVRFSFDHAAVQGSDHDLVVDFGRRLHDHAQLDARVLVREPGEARRKIVARAGRAGSEVQGAGLQRLHRLRRVLENLHRSQRGATRDRHRSAGVGQAHAAALTLQQLKPNRSLEVPDLLRHGPLRKEERGGCLRDVLVLGHRNEGAQLLEAE